MASSRGPLMALEEWRHHFDWHPWHFWGLAGCVPVDSACATVVREYAWQDANAAGRHDIAEALASAEEELAHYLEYDIAPTWHREERAWHGAGQITLGRGRLIAVGREMEDKIGEATVVYSDADGDGVPELARAAVPLDEEPLETNEVVVRPLVADRWWGEEWPHSIRPLGLRVEGGELKVRGPSWLFVRPGLWQGNAPDDLSACDPAAYVEEVALYRRGVAYRGRATLSATLDGCGGCCGTGGEHELCVQIVDARQGVVEVGGRCAGGCGVPRVGTLTIEYLAGVPRVDGRIDRRYAALAARFGAARMGRPICACDVANRKLHYWQFDLARAEGQMDEQYRIGEGDLTNPFGTARGAVHAWRETQALRRLVALSF